jgi:hypothetical protein
VKLGIAAAKPLIDRLDDEFLTRSTTTFGATQIPSLREVPRVGDLAVLILERISGRKFKRNSLLPGEAKRRNLAWHAEIEKFVEKQTLSGRVCRRDDESYE